MPSHAGDCLEQDLMLWLTALPFVTTSLVIPLWYRLISLVPTASSMRKQAGLNLSRALKIGETLSKMASLTPSSLLCVVTTVRLR